MRHLGRLATGLVLLAVCVSSAVVAPSASADVVTTWDTDFEGWTFTPSGGGSWEHSDTGGNPGGYVYSKDTSPSIGLPFLFAPSTYLGNYALFAPGAKFEYDGQAGPGDIVSGPGINLWGPGGRAGVRMPNATTEWVHYEIDIKEELWTVSEGTWSGLMANVTELYIAGDTHYGQYEKEICLDNFALVATVIPEPISMAFMGSAFVGVVGWRLRKRRKMRDS